MVRIWKSPFPPCPPLSSPDKKIEMWGRSLRLLLCKNYQNWNYPQTLLPTSCIGGGADGFAYFATCGMSSPPDSLCSAIACRSVAAARARAVFLVTRYNLREFALCYERHPESMHTVPRVCRVPLTSGDVWQTRPAFSAFGFSTDMLTKKNSLLVF